MHTFIHSPEFRIHHNAGFDGGILIVKKMGRNKWIECKTTSGAVLKLVKGMLRKYKSPDEWNGVMLVFKGERMPDAVRVGGDMAGEEVDVPLSCLVAFVADRYVRYRVENWLERIDDVGLIKLLPRVEQVDFTLPEG